MNAGGRFVLGVPNCVNLRKRLTVPFEAPASETPGVVYPAALVAGGPNPAGGKDLLEFLLSPAGLDLFREAGFGIAPGRP